jgi:hypothetical protein
MTRGKLRHPARVSALGYQFGFPDLDCAVHGLLGQPDSAMTARTAW